MYHFSYQLARTVFFQYSSIFHLSMASNKCDVKNEKTFLFSFEMIAFQSISYSHRTQFSMFILYNVRIITHIFLAYQMPIFSLFFSSLFRYIYIKSVKFHVTPIWSQFNEIWAIFNTWMSNYIHGRYVICVDARWKYSIK